MAPLTPFWAQPSHPDIQEVIINNEKEFFSKSISRIDLPPYAPYAKLSFPPCTAAEQPTYATVQMGKDSHLNLNSDLVYINHSCDPSVIFDMSSLSIIAGPKGLKVGDELTFFYPSTEWDMAQGFSCFCGAPTCRGHITGAKNMSRKALEGNFLNAHIRSLLEERDSTLLSISNSSPKDATEAALQLALKQAKKMVEAAQHALDSYKSLHGGLAGEGKVERNEGNGVSNGGKRRGVTSRELSGEMGGDTVV